MEITSWARQISVSISPSTRNWHLGTHGHRLECTFVNLSGAKQSGTVRFHLVNMVDTIGVPTYSQEASIAATEDVAFDLDSNETITTIHNVAKSGTQFPAALTVNITEDDGYLYGGCSLWWGTTSGDKAGLTSIPILSNRAF